MVCLRVILSVKLNILSCKGLVWLSFFCPFLTHFSLSFQKLFEKCQSLTFMIRLIYLPPAWLWLLDSSLSPWSLASPLWLSASFIDALWLSALQGYICGCLTPVCLWCTFLSWFLKNILWNFERLVWDVNSEPIHECKCQLVFLGAGFRIILPQH